MPVVSLTFEEDSLNIGKIIMAGLEDEKWIVEADARIKTEDDPVGVGPVVFTNRPEDPETNSYDVDGVVRDAVFLFFLENGVRRAEIFDQDPADLVDTVNDYLSSHGGDKTAMAALAPTV